MTTALVTGANRGIGLELCKQLLERGAHVVAVARTPSEALLGTASTPAAQGKLRIEGGVDVTSETACDALAGRLEGQTIDLLIHNAGILTRCTLDTLDLAAIR